jgi:predicted RNA-binding Zn ribbon-like protein
MVRWGLAPPGTTVDEATLEDARRVREGIRAVLRSHNRVKVDPEVLKRANRALAPTPPQFTFAPDGSAVLVSPEAGWPAACARILDGVVAAMASGRWKRFKACYEDSCQMAFYDASKNRMGKWCTVRRCGNRVNTRTYRRRKPRWQRG